MDKHMAREMTPQERATAFAEQIVRALDVHPSPINIDAVLPWVKETRRAALLEAAEVAESELFNLMVLASRPGQSSATWYIRNKLARLAQEG